MHPTRFQDAYVAADRYATSRSFEVSPANAYGIPGATPPRYSNVSSTMPYANYGPSPSYPSAPIRSGIVTSHTSSLTPAVGNMSNPYAAGFVLFKPA